MTLATAKTTNTGAPVLCKQQVPDNSCNAVEIQGYTGLTYQVIGSGTFTVTFKMSLDRTNYTPIECFSVADRSIAATATTATGAWRCASTYYNVAAAPISGCSGCNVTVVLTYGAAGVN